MSGEAIKALAALTTSSGKQHDLRARVSRYTPIIFVLAAISPVSSLRISWMNSIRLAWTARIVLVIDIVVPACNSLRYEMC